MLLTHQPDGSLLIELRWDHFKEKWNEALRENKLIRADKRPAVRANDGSNTYYTVHWHAWDSIKMHPDMRMPPKRGHICEGCGGDLKVKVEREDYWIMACPACESREIHSKSEVGGTIGAGEKEKT